MSCLKENIKIKQWRSIVYKVIYMIVCFEPCPWRGVLDATLSDKCCHWLAAGGRWLSSTNKTIRHDVTEIYIRYLVFYQRHTCMSRGNIWPYMIVFPKKITRQFWSWSNKCIVKETIKFKQWMSIVYKVI
jgi:hypothetical protein